MCGIFGFIAAKEKTISSAVLVSGTRSLSHRGPDDKGVVGWTADGKLFEGADLNNLMLRLGLGHRRLSILDLSSRGHQPMCDKHWRWIVHNGEIYNFIEIRKELIERGYEFQTETDTEVILAAYDTWGESCVARFNGMWAFAIYDSKRGCLFCSRDRLGVKPFYYAKNSNGFFFASEISTLLSCPGVRPIINRHLLASYLIDHRSDESSETFYSDIRELRGGNNMKINISTNEVAEWRYWSLPEETYLQLSEDDALAEFTDLFEDSVRMRLRSDVPVAILLSGGVDSSAVSVAVSKVCKNDICVFTSSFPENPSIDETKYADYVTKACGIKSYLVYPNLNSVLEEEPNLTRHQGMPYVSLSLYVHWAIIQEVKRRGFKVVLSGQGGDELFLGYERYYTHQLISSWPNIFKMLSSIQLASRNSRLSKKELIEYLAYFTFPKLQRTIRLKNTKHIYSSDIYSALPPPKAEISRDLKKLQHEQICGDQLGHLLRYDDRTGGAHGMETRFPFLDYRLVEFAYRLPLNHKIKGGWTKYLLRRYLERHIPSDVAWRRHKLGFNAPQREWTDSLIERRAGSLLQHPFSQLMLNKHMSIEKLSVQQRWDIYHCLHLASIYGWE